MLEDRSAHRRAVAGRFTNASLNARTTSRRCSDNAARRAASLAVRLCEGGHEQVPFTNHILGNELKVFAGVDVMDLEAIASKRIDAPCGARVRSRDCLKMKCCRTHALVLGGIERDDRTTGRLRRRPAVALRRPRGPRSVARLLGVGEHHAQHDGSVRRDAGKPAHVGRAEYDHRSSARCRYDMPRRFGRCL